MRFAAAQFFRLFVHTVREFQDAARHILRYRNRRAVIGLQHHAPHQFTGAHLVPALHAQVGVFRGRRRPADGKRGVHAFFFQPQNTGHHLGQTGGSPPDIGILLKNNTAGLGIDENCRLRLYSRRGQRRRGVRDDDKDSRKQKTPE